MKSILIFILSILSFTTFSQIKVTNTGYSVVFIDVIERGEIKILRMNICGEYESVNILKNEKPNELKLVFNNNTYINLKLLDDNFTNDDYIFYWTGNYRLSKDDINFLETFLLKEWNLLFKYYQVTEDIKTKNSLKFYNYINKKCINEETK
jgi:hypothetical protein